MSIYVCFRDYKEFLEYIVKDERSFKIENFERVISLKEDEKITLEYDKYNNFKSMIGELKSVHKEIKLLQVIIF